MRFLHIADVHLDTSFAGRSDVDEAFVNWDEERRDRGLVALAELSKMRQVFVFTCHPDTAAQLEKLGGRILRLQR